MFPKGESATVKTQRVEKATKQNGNWGTGFN